MKRLKLFFACLLMAVLSIGQMWGQAAAETTLFSENFGGYENNAVPSGEVSAVTGYRVIYGTNAKVTYTCTNGAGTKPGSTYVTTANEGNLAGGTSPELMVGKKGTGTGALGGSFSIAGIPSGGAQEITVSYKQNAQNLSVSISGTGYSTTFTGGKPSAAGERTFDITVADGADATFTLTFQAAATSNVRVDDILITVKTAGEGGAPSTPTCATPTFDPASGEIFSDDIDVEIACATDGVTIYYTTDGEDPTTSSDVYTTALNFTETTTLKAMAVKEGSNNSAVATATYTKMATVPGYEIDFESELAAYTDWTFVNFTKTNETITVHGGSYFAKTNATNTASITTKAKVANPGILTYYISKIGTNTNANSKWKARVSEDGTNWTIVGTEYAAASDVTAGTWKTCTADLTSYSNVFVQVYYDGTTAVRTIDDISLEMASAVAKPTITGEDNFLSTTEVTISIPDGATVYYTTDGSDPKSGSTYSAPFTLDESATVRAIAKIGEDYSAEASKEFTKATVLTPSEALAIINGWSSNQTSTQDYYVAGTISQIDDVNADSWATYYISADGTTTDQLQVYKGLWVNGANFSSVDQIQVGDDVTIKGKLRKYNSYKELDQNNEVVLYKLKARLAWTGTTEGAYDASLEGANTFPTLTNTNGVDVEYSSSNTDAATINPATGEISLVGVGQTTITATFTGNETYKANSASYTLNIASALVTLTYNVDGGEAIDPANVSALPNPLPTTTKAGYNFGGWFTDPEKTVDAVAGAAITENTTLYAKWLEPYTVAEALAMIDAMSDNETAENSIYVQGIVCVAPEAAPNSGRMTYFISADGDPASDQFQIYLGYGVSGANFTAQTDVQLEDAVVAYGKLKKYVKSTVVYPEFDKGSQLYSLVRKADPELAWSETSFDAYIGESNTFPTLTNDHNVAVTYSSNETDYATISNEEGHEGEITLVAVGTTTIKATFAGDENYKAAEVSYTLNVYNPITAGTITYEENGGSEVADVETPVDNLPDPLPEPTKENNIFAGWWSTSTFDENTQAVAGAPMSGDIILYAKWIEIPYYATVYTSNVEFGGTGSAESNSKVTINSVEYDAQKVGTSKGATGTVIVTVPAKTNTLHFHIFTWKNQSNTISISGDLTNLSASTINVSGDDAGGGSTPYNIESNPVDHYQFITFDPVAAPTEITFAHSEGTETRFIMYGINQEGGVLPVLDHIVITGDATELEYEVGDEFNPAGLGVNAIYTLESVEQDPVAVDAADIEWSFNPAHIAANTESVTVTATVGGKSANKTVENIVVNIPNPEILVDPASVAFGTVNQDATVDAEVINVTLKTVANATIALTGDVAAFTLDKTALTENGTISVTPVTSVAGTFAATITISDDASAAESKEVALSMTVKAPEVPDVCDGTDDFATIDKTVSPTGYATRTTTDGWVGTNVRFQEIDEKMYWKINGKTTAVGTITSPVLSDGIATLKFRYANTDTESNGVSVKIEIKQSGDVVKEYTLTKANSEVTKDEVYTEIIENINVAGDFQIVFTNLSPSNSTSNKDRVAIGRLCWTGYTAPVEPVWTDVRPGETLTVNKYYTVCLDKAITAIQGATLWSLNHKNSQETMAYLEEETPSTTEPLEAGKPFFMLTSSEHPQVVYTGEATSTPVENGALRGTLTGLSVSEINTIIAATASEGGIYMLYNNALRPVEAGEDNYLVAHRAYVLASALTVGNPSSAPGKRVIAMPMQGQTATGMENVQGDNVQCTKVLIDGQMYILRGEKLYDATGRLVK